MLIFNPKQKAIYFGPDQNSLPKTFCFLLLWFPR